MHGSGIMQYKISVNQRFNSKDVNRKVKTTLVSGLITRACAEFSLGKAVFREKKIEILTTFFLGQPIRFFEPSEKTIKTLICFGKNFCAASKLKKNRLKKMFCSLLKKHLTKKMSTPPRF